MTKLINWLNAEGGDVKKTIVVAGMLFGAIALVGLTGA